MKPTNSFVAAVLAVSAGAASGPAHAAPFITHCLSSAASYYSGQMATCASKTGLSRTTCEAKAWTDYQADKSACYVMAALPTSLKTALGIPP